VANDFSSPPPFFFPLVGVGRCCFLLHEDFNSPFSPSPLVEGAGRVPLPPPALARGDRSLPCFLFSPFWQEKVVIRPAVPSLPFAISRLLPLFFPPFFSPLKENNSSTFRVTRERRSVAAFLSPFSLSVMSPLRSFDENVDVFFSLSPLPSASDTAPRRFASPFPTPTGHPPRRFGSSSLSSLRTIEGTEVFFFPHKF